MIKFITGSKHKFAEISAVVGEGVLERLDLDQPEIQEIDPRKVVEEKVIEAIRQHHTGPVMVEDTSLFLDCLAKPDGEPGLPGPLVTPRYNSLGTRIVFMQRLLEDLRIPGSAPRAFKHRQTRGRYLRRDPKGLRYLLVSTPDPDEALSCLERLHEAHPEPFRRLTASSAGLQYMVAVFSYSRFLSEAVLQSPQWLEELVEARDIQRCFRAEEFEAAPGSGPGRGRRLQPAALRAGRVPAAPVAQNRTARRPERGDPARNHRGDFESRRRHSGSELPAPARRTGTPPRRA